MISACLVTLPGLEELAQEEVKNLAGAASVIKGSCVFFNTSASGVCRVAYRSQSAIRVLAIPSELDPSSLTELELSFKKTIDFGAFKNFIGKNFTFKVECERYGIHGYKSVEASACLGTILGSESGMEAVMDKPEIIFYLLVDSNKAVFGIDICGFDLSKRYYKVFPSPSSIRGPLAFAIRHFAGNGKLLLDPLCGSGEIIIEGLLRDSARPVRFYEREKLLISKIPVFSDFAMKVYLEKEKDINETIYAYDPHMPNVTAAKKNAKIAGVHKGIKFGRCALDWLDVKFKKGEVNAVATNTLRCDQKQLNRLFNQLSYICKDNAIVVVAGNEKLRESCNNNGFTINSLKSIGRKPIEVYLLSKQ
ncbi:MAG: THUMP domain-containing protein [Nanoarchaeota archaeon]